jgi:hypothetical protein
MKKVFITTMAVLLAGMAWGQELFKDGKTDWDIWISPTAGSTEKYAAQELQTALRKISGIEFKISPSENPPASNAVVIASLESCKQLPAALGITADQKEISVVRLLDGKLYLAGNQPRAALYAVYTFLTDVCGVRWLWAGETGEFMPARTTLDLKGLDITSKPAFQYRGFHLCGTHYCEETETWMARNRLNILRSDPINGQEWRKKWNDRRREKGLYMMFSTHNVSLPKTLLETRPELFAMIDGKRRPDQACWSNPEFVQMMIERFSKACEEYPEVEILSLFPADNMNYCRCDECAKHPLTDLWFDLFKKITDGVRAKHPQVKPASIAYQSYIEPPATDLRGLEFIEYCMYDRCYVHKFGECKINDKPLAMLEKWSKKEIPLAVYGYEFDIFNDKFHTPFYSMLADEMRKFRDLGICFVIPETTPWSYNAKAGDLRQYNHRRLAFYIYAALLWNPDADVENLIRDFSKAGFGPAGDAMADYFLMLAKAWDAMDVHYSYFFASPLGCSDKFLNRKLIADVDTAFKRADTAAAEITDVKQRADVQKQIEIEKKVFNVWRDMFNSYVAAQGNLKITAPRAAKPGVFDNAAPLPPLKAGKAGSTTFPTDVSLNWDNDALYIKAVCHDPAMGKLIANYKDHDSSVWADDCVELFIGVPNDTRGIYRHFAVNPLGTHFDSVALGGATYNVKDWNPEWKANVETGTDRWTATIKIPFKALDFDAPPKAGDTIQFSFKRSNGGSRSDYSSSGFPDASYHDQNAFGMIQFSDAAESRPVLFFGKTPVQNMTEMKSLADKADFQMTTVTEEAELPSLNGFRAIIIRHPGSKIKPEFYAEQVLPALENGAVVLFSSYGVLPLEKWFAKPELQLKWSGWGIDPERKTVDIMPGKWQTEPSNLENLLKSGLAPANGYLPVNPEGWDNRASLKMKNGEKFSFLLTRKVGKGLLAVTSADFGLGGGHALFGSDKKQSIMLLNNLYQLNKSR